LVKFSTWIMVFPFYRRFVFIGMSFRKFLSVHQG
jgi:hypothetical protein